MDCEKFDSLILDELYGELDDLTSAAMKRHASGCSGCADKLRSFEKTREHSALSEPDFPPGLEERILSAALEAEKVVPIGGRSGLSRIVSLAGMWAMRPQTAMAALFLLMIGSSAVLLRTRQPKESSSLTVTQEGAPSPAAVAANEEREFDGKGAAAAHGAAGAVPMATAAAAPVVAAAPGQMGRALGGSMAEEPTPGLGQLAQAAGETKAEARKEKGQANAQGPLSLGGGGYAPNAAPPPAAAPMARAGTAADEPKRDDGADPFASGMAAYQARRYPEATSKLDQAAAQGNPAAALWAARSVREGSGCPAAVGRFNGVAARGGSAGHDATFDAARCYDSMGDHEAARSRYAALLGVPAYASRARAALDSSSEMASRKAAAPATTTTPPAGGARAAPGKETAPPRAPAPTSVDKATSF